MSERKDLEDVIFCAEKCVLPFPGDCINCFYFDEENRNCEKDIIADMLFYLKDYQKIMNRTRTERLIEVLREVRGEK